MTLSPFIIIHLFSNTVLVKQISKYLNTGGYNTVGLSSQGCVVQNSLLSQQEKSRKSNGVQEEKN